MDETTFRILDALSRDLSNPTSINELTGKIRKLHKTAYYKNIYDKIQELKRQDFIKLERIGKSSVIWFNFNNYRLTEMLGEMEKEKKWKFLESREKMKRVFMDIKRLLDEFPVDSVIVINPESNLHFNRAEFFFLLNEPNDESLLSLYEGAPRVIYSVIKDLEKDYYMKLDCLVLGRKEFKELLGAGEANPIKEILPDHITIIRPEDFWVIIKEALSNGIKIKGEEEVNPAKISEADLTHNLSRFKYEEMGPRIGKGRDICLEYIITSILIGGDARRIEAVPTLLAKNKPRYSLLLFLCKKYGKLGKLLGLLKALDKIKKTGEPENAIKILEKMKVKEEPPDEKAIKQKMRLYHAI